MKRFTCSDKWDKPWFRNLSPKFKCFFQFLCDRCDVAGVWVVDMKTASHYVGDDIHGEKALDLFGGRVLDIGDGKWLIRDFVYFQYGNLSVSCNPHKRILEKLEHHGLIVDGSSVKSVGTLPKDTVGTLEDKDKEEEEDKEGRGSGGNQNEVTLGNGDVTRRALTDVKSVKPVNSVKFTKPTLEEVSLLSAKSGLPPIEAEKFFNHYESNGWRVGRNPMKDWHRALGNWKLNLGNYEPSTRNGNYGNQRIQRTKPDHTKPW